MNIREAMDFSKLTKKAIYFYINEKLVSPTRDETNGYYNFSENDLKTLKSIRILRELNVPIETISRMLKTPNLSPYYLHNHLDNEKKKLADLLHSTQKVQALVDNMSPKIDRQSLHEVLSSSENLEIDSEWQRLSLALPEREADIVAILVWRFFMEVPPNEYRNYLWGRIIEETDRQMKGPLSMLKWYMRLLNPSDIEVETAISYKRATAIAEAQKDKLDAFVDEIIEVCHKLVNEPKLQSYWKLEYESIIMPLLEFTSGRTGKLMAEYNPKYVTYFSNIQDCCVMARQRLLKGDDKKLYEQLLIELNGKFDPFYKNGAMLGFLYMYEDSLYTSLPLGILRSLMESHGYFED